MIEIGLKHTSELTVTEDVIAITVGSGDLPVLATPMMMALMENAAMLAVVDELPEGCTTVGGHIESSHLKPSKIGDVVRAVAEVTKVDGKKIEFKVSAYSGDVLLGEGTHLRFIVDREKFMSKFQRGFHLVTSEILSQLPKLPKTGIVNIFTKHTSCGLSINENADPDVRVDMETIFNRLVPENRPEYEHTLEGADDMPAHAKSTLSGVSITIPITDGRLNLGTWQGIYFCEYRNFGGSRELVVTIIGE